MTRPDTTRNERQRRWYLNHSDQKNRITRERYAQARAAGLCVHCLAPAIPGTCRCEECRQKRIRRKP